MKLSKVSTLCALLFLGSPDISMTSAAASSVLSSSFSAVASVVEEEDTAAHSNTDTAASTDNAHGRRVKDKGAKDKADKFVDPGDNWIYWTATPFFTNPDGTLVEVLDEDPANSVKVPVPANSFTALISPDYVLVSANLANALQEDTDKRPVSFKIGNECKKGYTKCGNLFNGTFPVAAEDGITFYPGFNPLGLRLIDPGDAYALVKLAKSVPTTFGNFSTPAVFDFNPNPNFLDPPLLPPCFDNAISPGVIDWVVVAHIDNGSADKDWIKDVLTKACYMRKTPGIDGLCINLKLDTVQKSGKGKGGKGGGKGKGDDDAVEPAVTVKRSGKHSKSRSKMSIGLNTDTTLMEAKNNVPKALTDRAQNKLTGKQPKTDRRRLQRRRGQVDQDSLYDFNVTDFEFEGECDWEEQQVYSPASCFFATLNTNVIHDPNLSDFETMAFSRALLEDSAESIASEVEGVVGVRIIDFGDESTADSNFSQLQGDPTVSKGGSASWVLPTTLIVVLTALAFIVIAMFVVIRKRRESSHYAPSDDGERLAKDTSATFFSDFNWGGESAGRGVETTMKDTEGVHVIKLSGASANSRVCDREEDSIVDDGSDGTESAGTRSRTSSAFRQYKFPSMVHM